MAGFHPPLRAPKDRHTYLIIVVCRVSDIGPDKQDIKSLDDQENMYREWLRNNVIGPFELIVIAGSGSGELLNRDEYQKLIDLVATGRYDLVLCEDLGRIIRRIHAHLICELCEDHDTRLFAMNDHVDTALPGWREASIFAAFHHERSNRDTSERIKRTHRSRFIGGACLHKPAYGWVKPAGAKSDAEMYKDPAAMPVYAEWFRLLDEENASFAEVARWLNAQGVRFPTLKRGESAEPDGPSVARHTFNPLLKGVRERNRRKSRRINNSGKYVSVKADPKELLQRCVPHLAFFDESYFDRVVAKVKSRNERYRRASDPKLGPGQYRPRRQTRYPGEATICEICGRRYVWGGHGQTDHMMCNGAREHRCWNGATFDGVLAARRIASATLEAIEGLSGFDLRFLQAIDDEAIRVDGDRQRRIEDLRIRLDAADLAVANFLKFVRGGDESLAVRDELRLAEKEQAQLAASIAAEKGEPTNGVQIPDLAELKQLGRKRLADLDVASEEFARVMRRLAPVVRAFPVRLCDGGSVKVRAQVTLQLSELITDGRAREVLRRPLQRELLVDLFDPPQRAAFRERVVAGRTAGRSERAVAAELGITVTAAQHAMSLQREMDQRGITDPYVLVLEPPPDVTKLRRHLNSEYAFEPLPVTDQT